MTAYISNLYKYDTRYGDGLVSPMRSCATSLSLSFSTLKTGDHPDLLSLAKRIGNVVKHFFATVLSSIPAAVGLLIKACQKEPQQLRAGVANPIRHRSLLDILDRRQPAQQDIPSNIIARERADLLKTLDPNLLTHIATWLTPREQVTAMPTSKYVKSAMRASPLWSHFLNHEDFRIHGATRWSIKPIDPKAPQLKYTPDNKDYLEKPFEQLLTYHVMFANNPCPEIDLFQYFARIMKGGPLAFAKIPKLRLEIPCENLSPELLDSPLSAFSKALESPFTYPGFDVPAHLNQGPQEPSLGGEHSFLIGFDVNNVPFFSLRVVHAETEGEGIQSMIIFAKNADGFFQIANGPWEANTLRLSNDTTLNFLLRLLNNETLSLNMPQGIKLYKKPVES